ncbi:FkbM family methyltransferase [Nitrosospira sp. Nsp5]|uniref:Methyltransferase, FkbM family n=1 Tax=Nitrosospira multiformis TaxID=1231 RepID=A0ABY0TB51_9PROT|nr:FkbM family methyltransferase [Nitrosospira sp. Nsp5]SDQ30792.1 methyltransferase, FkbM family [Nitrosospira multiformis]
MGLRQELRSLLRKVGYDVSRFDPASHSLARRKKLLETYAIDTVLDVGANIGQFARELRRDLEFSGKIISFEPQSSAFETLKKNAVRDSRWEVNNFALGDEDGTADINIAGNSYSSSLFNMLPSHLKSAPSSGYIGRETICIKTLDSVIDSYCSLKNNIYLKIDTQGFEHKVIKGADKSLDRICMIQLEMSLVPLYQGQILFNDLNSLLTEKGYKLVSIEHGFSDRDSGHLLQVDGVYHRS